jgi:hypothetical protein
MKTLLTLPLLLLSLISFPSWGETIDGLVLRDGIYYKKFSDVPFTGVIEGQWQGGIKNGKREGPWIFYWKNGQLMSKGNYKNGKEEGSWVHYEENGQLSSKGNFKNGKKNGYWVTYRESGQVWTKGNYNSDSMEGRWFWYEHNGTLYEGLSGIYRNNVKISD